MKTYIKPETEIQNVMVELLLISESGGQLIEGDAKRHDYNDNYWTNEEDEDDEFTIYDRWE